jgi:hypothetical protein
MSQVSETPANQPQIPTNGKDVRVPTSHDQEALKPLCSHATSQIKGIGDRIIPHSSVLPVVADVDGDAKAATQLQVKRISPSYYTKFLSDAAKERKPSPSAFP